MRILKSLIIFSILAMGCSAITPNPKVKIEKAFPNLEFTRPVDFQQPAGENNNLFVVEQAGRIFKFANKSTTSLKELFLDITGLVNDKGNEEGLLGLAFHPDFKENGYFFVNYTAENPKRTVIARFEAKESPENTAETQKIILEYAQPYSNHNGGQVLFGPDGYLYIAVGDGGSGGDPHGNGQNKKTLLGKILRIDVNATQNNLNYAIPADNPFAGNKEGYREEIFAYGLRNPWRFCFHPATGAIWAGDVGQNKIEEIDIIVKGGNYGWNIMEASECFQPPQNCDQTGLIKPIYEYTHSVGYSITGGRICQDNNIPNLKGAYIYADFVVGKIWALFTRDDNNYENVLLTDAVPQISSFGEDKDNNLYVLSFDGYIYRLKP